MYMVMYVLDDTNLLDELLESLCAIGVCGATILDSTGMHRRRARTRRSRFHFPFEGRLDSQPEENLTLFFTVPDEASVHGALAAIEQVVGDLAGPRSGLLASWPLTVAKGLRITTARASSGDGGDAS